VAQLETPSRIIQKAAELQLITPTQIIQIPSVSLNVPVPNPTITPAPTTGSNAPAATPTP
jgi:hypothetical protein